MKSASLLTFMLLLTFLGFLGVAPAAEATQVGADASLGQESSSTPRQYPVQSRANLTNQRTVASGGRPPGQSGGTDPWHEPLDGVAAGGPLASLAMGDGFDGFRFLDYLLIGLLIVGVVLLSWMFRRGRFRSQAAEYEGGADGDGACEVGPYQLSVVRGLRVMSPGMGEQSSLGVGQDESPVWFDGPGFLETARTHFIRFQAAWDHAAFRDMGKYTTRPLFAELRRERQRLGGTLQTEIELIDAELVGIRREGDLVVASVFFSGLIREEEQGVAEEFREIWHVQHPWSEREGNWSIAGIQLTDS
jgi:predicted lipid-binding transport protein (Tim44 family)